jgi:hypothetical protein
MRKSIMCSLLILSVFVSAGTAAALTDSLKVGKADIQSASQLAFGPEGILFIGDSLQGALFAVATEDTKPTGSSLNLDIKGLNQKIAAMLGVGSDQILINDIKVNPMSHQVYIAVSRGRGPDAIPVILKIDGSGKLTGFSLNSVKYAMVNLGDPPASKPDAPNGRNPEGFINGNPRSQSITDMAYIDGKVIVAGLSNEEFASDLRYIPFPFRNAERGTGIQIWHSSHGRYETSAPIRKFVPYMIDKQPYILASYTCTPLVKIPVSALKPGSKVTGTTIAELGDSNQPLEMVPYRKDGHEYILMANSKRGMMKVAADNLGSYKAITPPTAACEQSREGGRGLGPKECQGDTSGVPYETLNQYKGVWQLAKIDDGHALVLAESAGKISLVPGHASSFTIDPASSLDLTTIPLP